MDRKNVNQFTRRIVSKRNAVSNLAWRGYKESDIAGSFGRDTYKSTQ